MKKRRAVIRPCPVLLPRTWLARMGIGCLLLLCLLQAPAQSLKAGFQAPEYLEMLRITGRIEDSLLSQEKSPPTGNAFQSAIAERLQCRQSFY